MHHRDRDLVAFQLIHLLDHIAADLPVFLVRKPGQGAVCALSHRIDDLLNVEHFLRSVLLDHLHIPLRPVLFSVIRFLFPSKLFYRIFHSAVSPSVSLCSFPSDRFRRPPSSVRQPRHSAWQSAMQKAREIAAQGAGHCVRQMPGKKSGCGKSACSPFRIRPCMRRFR